MKKLLIFIVFNFYLINPSYGNQIEDFQIEDISMWDSALKHFSKAEIINNKKLYYQYIKKDKDMFSTSEISGNYENYDVLQFSYKTNDPKFKIYYIAGIIDFDNDVESCYEKKKEVEKDLKILFPNLRNTESNIKLRADPTGQSFAKSKVFWFPNNAYNVAIRCYDWSSQSQRTDHLRINIKSKQFNDWIGEK